MQITLHPFWLQVILLVTGKRLSAPCPLHAVTRKAEIAANIARFFEFNPLYLKRYHSEFE
jgi:hypothetical protein